MSVARMHAEEIDIDASLVRRLLAAQFPHWAALPILAVSSSGTDHALFRLGEDMVVRVPRIHWATGQAELEHQWLPRLAPFLPLTIPQPLALGRPGEGFSWHWLVCRWLEGETAALDRMADVRETALDLARFIDALHRIPVSDWPSPAPPKSARGEPLAARDARTREAIASLRGAIDTALVTAAWEQALAAPQWHGAPVWIHGDLQAGNLLTVGGRLSAVIDFGCLGLGDPAVDVMTAWIYLSAETRVEFRAALSVDDATWTRARGWALWFGLIALPYYQTTNPTLAEIARRAIDEVVADYVAIS